MNRNYFGFVLKLILSVVAAFGYGAFNLSTYALAAAFLAILFAQHGGEEDQMNSSTMTTIYNLALVAGLIMFVIGIVQGKIFK